MQQTPPVDTCHMLLKVGRLHCYSALSATYPCPILFLQSGTLPHRLLIIRLLSHFPPDKSRCAYHGLSLPQVCVYPNLIKYPYECHQCALNPYVVSPHHAAIVVIKHYFLLPHRPSQSIMGLLVTAYLQQIVQHFLINHYVEDGGGNWVYLVHPLIRLKWADIAPPVPCDYRLTFPETLQEPL